MERWHRRVKIDKRKKGEEGRDTRQNEGWRRELDGLEDMRGGLGLGKEGKLVIEEGVREEANEGIVW